ncbi:MAG TPA: hypothetical protein VHB21_01305 [Minicystis sp.]|nr:hypothetical protein [Minicystis sp.]
MPTPADVKKALQAAGFEIYRTRGDVVHVAERVRENLLMDSGVFLEAQALVVGFVVRAQKTDFPHDGDDALFERARRLGAAAVGRGYTEASAEIRTVVDPGDAGRAIDRWCEVAYKKPAAALDAAIEEIRFALTLEKAAAPS